MGRKFRLSVHRKNEERKKKATTADKEQLHDQTEGNSQDLSGIQVALEVKLPNSMWHQQVHETSYVHFSKIVSTHPSSQPALITRCIKVRDDRSWVVFIHNHKLVVQNGVLSTIPQYIDSTTLSRLLDLVDSLPVCPGNPDSHFLEMAAARKGHFQSKTNELTAFTDSFAPVSLNGECYPQTVRTTTCELLVHGGKCKPCKEYRAPLRAMYSRWSTCKGKEVSKYTNDQHLRTPQKKQKLESLKTRAQEAEREVKRLQTIIEKLTNQNGVSVDPSLGQDLVTIMDEKSDEIAWIYHPGSFKRLFWEQQLKAAKAKGVSGMRWHPVMIRWALNLKMISSAGYHAMRTAGFIQLPSERTLRDYTHFYEAKPGFQKEINQQLMQEARINELDEIQKHVVVAFD